MSNKKRRRESDAAANGADEVHPSRKQRVQYGEADAELAQIFNGLRDELPSVRSEATVKLLKNLLAHTTDRQHRIDNAITRLIKGSCSGAKAARIGFSMALSEVLRLTLSSKLSDVQVDAGAVAEKIVALSSLDGKPSGEEKRNSLLGRCFALQAVLQSEILLHTHATGSAKVLGTLAELAAEKTWLRTECGAVLRTFLSDGKATSGLARQAIDSWASKGLLKSPEGVALWLVVKDSFPDMKLPKGVWHHNNPLVSQERTVLSRILIKNENEEPDETTKKAGARQSTPSFAWDTILKHLFGVAETKQFSGFWSECVASPMFSTASSPERKALGLQVFTLALKTAPTAFLQDVLHPNIMRCIIQQRSKADNLLFEATKPPLSQISSRAKGSSADASRLALKLVQLLPGVVDKLTKNTVDTVLAALDTEGLLLLVQNIDILCREPGVDDERDAELKRRLLADVLLQLVRTRRGNTNELFRGKSARTGSEYRAHDWLDALLKILICIGYDAETGPLIKDSSRAVFRERLASVLGDLLNNPLHYAIAAPRTVIKEMVSLKDHVSVKLKDDELKAVKQAYKLHKTGMAEKASTTSDALRLLLFLGILQVYRQEPDAVEVLMDIATCVQTPGDDTDSNTMLVELLLSFASKQSALFRRLAEQVFSAFTEEVSVEALQSMIDILSQKESLAGQQELFDQNDEELGDGEDSTSNSDAEDGENIIDVEDASDVDMELLNGNLLDDASGSDSDDSDDDLNDSESEEEASISSPDGVGDDDAELKRKAATVLGTAGGDEDSDDDGSDMDDEQMIEADKHLITFFKEQKKVANKKQESKDAKANIVNFKNRVLDLLDIYVKSQYANVIALDLILPLVTLVRTTGSQPTAKKAYEVLEKYFDSAKKHKQNPQPDSAEDVFAVLSAIHDEMRLGGSRMHANACSRASHFLSKVLVAMDEDHFLKVDGMYSQLRHEWRKDTQSKIQASVFNDWHSWSMQR